MRKIALISLMVGVVTLPFYLNGCSNTTKTAKGGAIGAVAGGALGVIIGDKPGREEEGALIGTIAGGLLGGYIGSRLDKQAQALQSVQGMKQVTVNKNEGNQGIESRMQINFGWDTDEISSTEMPKLDQLASILRQYPENIVMIEGHTDDSGEADYNQELSERRANAIKEYLNLQNLGIPLNFVGYGEAKPIAPNESQEGRAQNRRVEIKIKVDQERARQLYEAEK
jgi:outer membrane protein OmpA-like peptidoglycan-associated protein